MKIKWTHTSQSVKFGWKKGAVVPIAMIIAIIIVMYLNLLDNHEWIVYDFACFWRQ